MQTQTRQLNEEFRDLVKGIVASSEFKELQKQIENEDTGTFRVVVSTEDEDRVGDVIRTEGWELGFFRQNPVVLWAHSHDQLPIGIADTIEVQGKELVAEGRFAPHPFAQQVRQLFESGIVTATSVGFIPKAFDDDDPSVITRAELLEFSFVPVPANPNVTALAADNSFNTFELVQKGLMTEPRCEECGQNEPKEKGLCAECKTVPGNPSDYSVADRDTSWNAPSLGDFTDESWEDLPASEKNRIASHFTWRPSGSINDVDFGDLKLPHHRPSDGAVVFNGVIAAIAAINGARGGTQGISRSELQRAYNHLARHVRVDFDEDPPEFNPKAAEGEEKDESEDEQETQEEKAPVDEKQVKEQVGVELEQLRTEINDATVNRSRNILDIVERLEPQGNTAEQLRHALDSMEGLDQLKEITAVLQPWLQNSEGEDQGEKNPAPKQRSSTAESIELKRYRQLKKVLQVSDTAINKSLEKIKEYEKEHV